MRDLKFWAERLQVAKKRLSKMPVGVALNDEPTRRNFMNWGQYRAAYSAWLSRERLFRALARRRERLVHQAAYFEKQVESLSPRSSRILRNPVI